jgi:hypothetical protein
VDLAQEVVDTVRAIDANVPVVIGGLAMSELARSTHRGVTAFADSGRDAVEIIAAPFVR